MLNRASAICLRCRLSMELTRTQADLFNRSLHVTKRFRSSTSSSSAKPKSKPKAPWRSSLPRRYPHFDNLYTHFSKPVGKDIIAVPPAGLGTKDCSSYFQRSVKAWSTNSRTLGCFQRFGFSRQDIQPILDAYSDAGMKGFFSTEEKQAQYYISRFAELTLSEPGARQAEAEITFSNIFFSWCCNIGDSRVLDKLASQGTINPTTLSSLRFLAEAAQRRPAEEFSYTRKIHRKVIMHVGPTNSGKTHHALRALAAAKTGVYAGPLRLLAHEIWERLNLGQIIPLGVDDQLLGNKDDPSSLPNGIEKTALSDRAIATEAQKFGNPKYARKTNMVTGEEKKIVDEDSGLMSCTIEMLSTRVHYDVGVIDEIQLIGDPQRGFAWTAAVLGLCAKELHLCGEESAIPIVEALLKETGDDLEVRRYERLTPLTVEEESLGGDYSKVKKGDCVVAFSRSKIFQIKEEIERKSGLRCAVVYGKLPPEIRSEQASLFNDPNSNFDVIIGSDAIGMGLNLRIRRIVFDQTSKVNGSGRMIPLSFSQTKQIAGRAGRYGHSLAGEAPGGYATTLHEKDLPYLREALLQPFDPIPYAHVGATLETFENLIPALPPDATLEAAQMAHVYASNLPPIYRYSIPGRLADICHFIDTKARGQLTWAEKYTLFVSPVGWRDDLCVRATEQMVRLQRDNMSVNIYDALKGFEFLDALGYMERQMASGKEGKLKEGLLEALESFHKVLVYYMWMHFRYPVVYSDRERTEQLKHRVELALDWGLQQLGKNKGTTKSWEANWKAAKILGNKLSPPLENPRVMPLTGRYPAAGKPSSAVLPQPTRKIEYTNKSAGAGIRHWDKAPDLSPLLNKYLDFPASKRREVDRRSNHSDI